MTQTIALQIQQPFSDQLKKASHLFQRMRLMHDVYLLSKEHLRLMDHHNRFIGTGYYGIQNKGIGWVLTTDANETIDKTFYKKFKSHRQSSHF